MIKRWRKWEGRVSHLVNIDLKVKSHKINSKKHFSNFTTYTIHTYIYIYSEFITFHASYNTEGMSSTFTLLSF